jgi:hypothetical protein
METTPTVLELNENRKAIRLSLEVAAKACDRQDEALAAIAQELRIVRTLLVDCDGTARRRGDRFGVCDCIDNQGNPYPSRAIADALVRARKALGRRPPPAPRCPVES